MIRNATLRKVGFFSTLLSTVALAATLPVSGPIQGQTGFDTMDAAAIAAEEMVVHKTISVEQAGAIYELGGKFYFTAPASNEGGDYFHVAVQFPVGAKFVGLYHDHPYAENNDMFSFPDVLTANQLHVTSYIAVIREGGKSHILKYVPGVTATFKWTNGLDNTLESSGLVSRGVLLAPLSI